ncbi:uncharacterized protein LOC115736884 [Rhodamnia argentea]|uniref:Uncharacterized protein LOC115736884 n=1 Tax=Rhodamnia argentea TaxID=178133 RepID=A0A8B8NR12_9MYRT|nr:uncharacterized protein LOC115736884 [Rhodamnia argentea]
MAMYVDEEEVWKCPKHPTRRRRSGICPKCLRERLDGLCPDCANLRPCSCCASTTSSSSSSSSSFSRFFAGESAGGASVGKVSNLIDSEPSFRRSRSVAVSFFRSRSKFVRELDADIGVGVGVGNGDGPHLRPADSPHRTPSFFGLFSRDKSKRAGPRAEAAERTSGAESDDAAAERRTMMRKSRSVAVTSNPLGGRGAASAGPAAAKGRSWHFPSPMKVFRQSKLTKVVGQERSPLYRG